MPSKPTTGRSPPPPGRAAYTAGEPARAAVGIPVGIGIPVFNWIHAKALELRGWQGDVDNVAGRSHTRLPARNRTAPTRVDLGKFRTPLVLLLMQ
jgi:hypothetical protein